MVHSPFLRRAGWSLLWLLPLPLLADASGLDLWLERRYFDAARADFPWRHVAWLDMLMHEGLRLLLALPAAGVLVLLLAAWAAPASVPGAGWRRPRLLAYLLLALLAGPVVVALLKQVSVQACPWSLAAFGGSRPYASLLAGPVLRWHATGKCWPGAHASGGFALLAFVPVLSGRRRLLMLGAAVLLGMAMGWTRMMQGAHFLSHNLWSAWICWATTLAAFALVRPLRPGSAPTP